MTMDIDHALEIAGEYAKDAENDTCQSATSQAMAALVKEIELLRRSPAKGDFILKVRTPGPDGIIEVWDCDGNFTTIGTLAAGFIFGQARLAALGQEEPKQIRGEDCARCLDSDPCSRHPENQNGN